MDAAKLQSIHISESQRRRSVGAFWGIVLLVAACVAIALYFARPWASDERTGNGQGKSPQSSPANPADAKPAVPVPRKSDARPGEAVLTISGYIINRERIELSPRVMNEVKWIGVKKGDRVKKGDIVVRLDDSEQQARIAELDGSIAVARVAIEKAKLTYGRVKKLRSALLETAEREDETRLAVASAEAQLRQLEGTKAMALVWLDWTVIKSPIDGVVLEKLSVPGELVTPQSFGGTKGPSTAP